MWSRSPTAGSTCTPPPSSPCGHRPADVRAELLRRYGTWHDPIPALLERIDPAAVLQHDLYDLAAPLPRFHHGRLAWLGDAAHAMTPNLGQGGCQAVEDAAVLGHLLVGTDAADVPAALAAYSAARCARTDAIRVRARRAGRVAALSHPLAVAVRDLAVRATPPGPRTGRWLRCSTDSRSRAEWPPCPGALPLVGEVR